MVCNTWVRTALLTGVFAIVTQGASAVNESGNGAQGQIEEITVTAQKRSEAVNSVPMSITAVTGAGLRELGIQSVSDLSKVVPSFTTTTGFFGATTYTIRGVGFYDDALGSRPTVGIYLDEVELPFAIMSKGCRV